MQQSITELAEKPSIINSSPPIPRNISTYSPLEETKLNTVTSLLKGAGDILSSFLAQYLDATFRRFQPDIKDSVNETIENTSGIISRALQMRTELNEENNSEISRLQELTHRLRLLMLHQP